MGSKVNISLSCGQLELLLDYLDLAQESGVALSEHQKAVKQIIEEHYNQEVLGGGI